MGSHRSLQSKLKRIMDLLGAVFALLFFLPFQFIAILVIIFTMGFPVFFIQERPGLYGKPFKMVKFRTMHPPRSDEVWFLSDDQRMCSAGKILRATSIDEIPSLWNVLKGDMSLVGPRPLIMEYLEQYTPEQNRRHEVLPGITGWSQVNGRQEIKFSQRLELDLWYVDHWSVWLDIKILWITLWKVLRLEGVTFRKSLEEVDDLGFTPCEGVFPQEDKDTL